MNAISRYVALLLVSVVMLVTVAPVDLWNSGLKAMITNYWANLGDYWYWAHTGERPEIWDIRS